MQMIRVMTLVMASASLLVAAPVDIAGRWQLTVELEMGTGRPVVTFKQDGEKLTGTYEGRYGKSDLAGTVTDKQVEFTVTTVVEGTTVSGVFSATFDSDRLSGSVEWEGAGAGTWTAVRIPAKP